MHMTLTNSDERRELQRSELRVFFYIGENPDEREIEAQRLCVDVGYDALAAAFHNLADIAREDLGQICTLPLEIGEVEWINERPAFGVNFVYEIGEFPLNLAITLRALVLSKMAEAAGGRKVEFAKATVHETYTVYKTIDWNF